MDIEEDTQYYVATKYSQHGPFKLVTSALELAKWFTDQNIPAMVWNTGE